MDMLTHCEQEVHAYTMTCIYLYVCMYIHHVELQHSTCKLLVLMVVHCGFIIHLFMLVVMIY